MCSANGCRRIGIIGAVIVLLFMMLYTCGGKAVDEQKNMQMLDTVIDNM